MFSHWSRPQLGLVPHAVQEVVHRKQNLATRGCVIASDCVDNSGCLRVTLDSICNSCNVLNLWYLSQCSSELLRFLISSEVCRLNWKDWLTPILKCKAKPDMGVGRTVPCAPNQVKSASPDQCKFSPSFNFTFQWSSDIIPKLKWWILFAPARHSSQQCHTFPAMQKVSKSHQFNSCRYLIFPAIFCLHRRHILNSQLVGVQKATA